MSQSVVAALTGQAVRCEGFLDLPSLRLYVLTYGERLSMSFMTYHDMHRVLNMQFIPFLERGPLCTLSGIDVGFLLLLLGDDSAVNVHPCNQKMGARQ